MIADESEIETFAPLTTFDRLLVREQMYELRGETGDLTEEGELEIVSLALVRNGYNPKQTTVVNATEGPLSGTMIPKKDQMEAESLVHTHRMLWYADSLSDERLVLERSGIVVEWRDLPLRRRARDRFLNLVDRLSGVGPGPSGGY